MANHNPSPQTRFKKGNKAGKGRTVKNPVRSDEVKRIVAKLWRVSLEELKERAADPKTTMGELMVARIMMRIVKDGDANRWTALLDRVIGRVQVAEDDGEMEPFVIHKLEGGQLLLGVAPTKKDAS